jgi:ABC-type ATPase involved in cell division
MIHFNQVTTLLDGQTLFQDISFFLPKASYTYVYGEDGSGKSTLLRMIAGELPPTQGTVTVNGMELHTLPADRLPYYRRQVGWVESQPALLDNLSTAANVRMPLEIAGLDRRGIRERTAEILELLGLTVLADVPATTVVVTDPNNIPAVAANAGRLELTQGRAFFHEHTSSAESHQ